MKSSYQIPIVIAEIGCNHKGDIQIAKDLIKHAAVCGVQVVKFQKRSNVDLLSDEQYNAPHPNPANSYGNTYGSHREFLEFDIATHKSLKKFAESLNLIYSTSVWDIKSAREVIDLNPKFIKVPSACNTNFVLLEFIRDNYNGDIHISLGMTNLEEEIEILETFQKTNALNRVVLYSCTSGYPVSFKDVCLLEILRIRDKYINKIKDIGFSGHHLGIAIDNAAYTLGANYIERHFTLDRTWKGTDHAASLEPTGMRKLVRDLRATQKSLTFKSTEILEIENDQRNKLKFFDK
ncbi:MAG: N-acetylneuraminate synthase [Flavobacteriales bacterium]|nr:N-acetylneuraminate synthase [Flavobacteriales bacterium]